MLCVRQTKPSLPIVAWIKRTHSWDAVVFPRRLSRKSTVNNRPLLLVLGLQCVTRLREMAPPLVEHERGRRGYHITCVWVTSIETSNVCNKNNV